MGDLNQKERVESQFAVLMLKGDPPEINMLGSNENALLEIGGQKVTY